MDSDDFQFSELEEGFWLNNMSPPEFQFNVDEIINDVEWSVEENKVFENALADQAEIVGTPAFFQHLATLIPGKSMQDIMAHYEALVKDVEMIESGMISTPEYLQVKQELADNLVKEEEEETSDEGYPFMEISKKSSAIRRRGIPWTPEEHQLFLRGLHRFGKGDWRSISRYYVTNKTPTQIASHAQKYFRRQTAPTPAARRRQSIHDIHILGTVAYPSAYTPLFPTNSLSALAPAQMSFYRTTNFPNNSMTGVSINPTPMPFQTAEFLNKSMTGMSTNPTPMPFQMTSDFLNNSMAGMGTNSTPVSFQRSDDFLNNSMAGMSTNATPMSFQTTTAFMNNSMVGVSTNPAPIPFQTTTASMTTNATPMPFQKTTTDFMNNYMTGESSIFDDDFLAMFDEDPTMFEEDPTMFVPGVNFDPHMPSSSMTSQLWC